MLCVLDTQFTPIITYFVASRSLSFKKMGKGKNAKRREKKRRQALRQAREEAAAARATDAAGAAGATSAAPVAVPMANEAAMVQAMMEMTGQTKMQVLQMRDKALRYVQEQPPDKVMKKVTQSLTQSTRELHTTLEQIQGIGGSDMHVWHEVGGIIYDLPSGVDGDIQKFNKDNPDSPFTLRRPYPPSLQEECFQKFVKSKLQRALMIPQGIDVGLGNEKKWENRCVERAALLMALYPETFDRTTLRIGGVGWREKSGIVHWEFG